MTVLPVSVVIPVYNHEQYIVDTLESVLKQSSSPAEVIVVDDGSTDKSASIIRDYSRNRPELIFWSQPNQGAHQAINAGIHRASGKYISILNSDDIYHPERLEKCVGIMEGREEVSAVFTGVDFINGRGQKINNPWYEQARQFFEKNGDIGLALMNGNFVMTTSNFVLRRSVFKKLGYFMSLRYAHDLDFLLRLVARGEGWHILQKELLSYRIHEDNTISEDHKKVRMEWAFCCARYMWMMGGGCSEQKWTYHQSMIDVLLRHNLAHLALMFFPFFRKESLDAHICDSFTSDIVLQNVLYKMA